MKILKVILVLVGLFIAGIVGLGFFMFSQADNVVKGVIERAGTYALGVETTVDSVHLGFTDGTFGMSGFNIANPEGFDRADFLTLGETGVDLDMKSLSGDVITVPSISMVDLDLNLLKNGSGSNYGVILENLKKFESSDQSTPSGDEGGAKFVINEIRITDVDIHAQLTAIGGDLTAVDVDLDEIILTNVGSPSGVNSGELINIVIKAVLSAVTNKAGDILPADMLGDLESGLAQLESLGELGVGVATEGVAIIGDITDEAGKAIEDAAQEGQKVIDDAGKEIGRASCRERV